VVRHGRSFISPLLSGTLADHSAAMNQGRHRKPDHKALTPRQIEILRLISRGKSSKEIADLLLISTRTVENHRANIMDRLEMRKNIDLVRYAIRSGYLPADEL
jgi:DNA-binding NarL/FixJ family response regulator